MLKVTLTCGIPACGKSTWAKEEVAKDPENTIRINRDDLRIMLSNYYFSKENEKLVTSTKDFLLLKALKSGKNVILDETNLNKNNFDDVCKKVKELNIDCEIIEKLFYIELEEAITRDSVRLGYAKVGEEVVRKFWNKSGKDNFKNYIPRTEVFYHKEEIVKNNIQQTNSNLPLAIVADLDGTLSLFNKTNKDGSIIIEHEGAHIRSPYDASNCDKDMLNKPVAEVVDSFYKKGYKIIFCSGREDIYRQQTEEFIKKHLDVKYELFMRKTGDHRKDSIIKEEIYNNEIVRNYNVFLVLDDRNCVIDFWRSVGLTCFQVAEGNF